VNSPLDVKENDEHAPDCSSPVSSFFYLGTARGFFPESESNHCQGLSSTRFEISTKLIDPPRNRVTPDTRLQMEGRQQPALGPSCVIQGVAEKR
jgi:hypothetical protein